MKKNNYLLVIPCRMKSTRLPNKPLIDIAGKTLIQRTCEQVNKAVPIENFLVATDNKKIYNHVKKLGFNVELTSKNCLTGTDRVAEIAARYNFEYFINVQGDEPIINPKDIEKAINYIEKYPNEILSGYAKINDSENYFSLTIPKVVFTPERKLLYISRSNIPGNKKNVFTDSWKQVCIYVYPKKTLKEFSSSICKTPLETIEDIELLRFLELGYTIRMIEMSSSSIAVDVPSDVNKVLKKINENS